MLRKKSWMELKSAVAVAMAMLIGMLAVGCGSDSPSGPDTKPGATPSELVGTWEAGGGMMSMTVNGNGTFQIDMYGIRYIKGNLQVSGRNITMLPTHVHGDIFGGMIASKWYTKSELKTAINAVEHMTNAEFEEEYGYYFEKDAGTYVLKDDKLSITIDGQTITFTKSSGSDPGPGTGGTDTTGTPGTGGTDTTGTPGTGGSDTTGTGPGTTPGTTPSELNGTWSGSSYDEDGDEYDVAITLNNGSFEMSQMGVKALKGTFSTSGNNVINLKPTHISGALFALFGLNPSAWYLKNEIKEFLISLGVPDVDEILDEMFSPKTGTYVLNGNTLYLTLDDETAVLTKESGTNPGTPTGPVTPTPSGLNGTWNDNRGYVLTFDNGTLVMKFPIVSGGNAVNLAKGNYSVTADYIVLDLKYVHGDAFNAQFETMIPGLRIDSKWYTIPELKTALKNVVGEAEYNAQGLDDLIDQMYGPLFDNTQNVPYSLSGNNLVFGGSTYAKQSSLSKAIASVGRKLHNKGSDFDIGVCLRGWLVR